MNKYFELEKLQELKESGIITLFEYEKEKDKLLNTENDNKKNRIERKKVLNNISSKEMLSCSIWAIIGVIQIVGGYSLINYNDMAIFIFLIGIYNVINSILIMIKSRMVNERAKDLIQEYEKSLTPIIISFFINVILGAIIGVVGALFDFATRNYVLNNEDIIDITSSHDDEKYKNLEILKNLKELGKISEEEFETEKRKILD